MPSFFPGAVAALGSETDPHALVSVQRCGVPAAAIIGRGNRRGATKMLSPGVYERIMRPLFFALPPEAAQRAAHLALRQRLVWRSLAPLFAVKDDRLATELCGIGLDNPVGLAAGFDKDCKMLPSLAALGFGYVVGGTVTAEPRAGNPRPRMVRYAREQSLMNSLGFRGQGLDRVANRLERSAGNRGGRTLVMSVSGTAVDDIVRCHRRLEPLADAVEINISSPNTAGLRIFQEPPALVELIDRVNENRGKSLMVKLPPYSTSGPEAKTTAEDRERAMSLVAVCVERGVDGVTVANSRPAREPRLAVGAGGLSGRAVFPGMVRMVADVRRDVGDRLTINACGGVFTGEDAWEAIKAGADTVQLYTGMLYRGPGIVRDINRGLLRLMAAEDVESTREFRRRS